MAVKQWCTWSQEHKMKKKNQEKNTWNPLQTMLKYKDWRFTKWKSCQCSQVRKKKPQTKTIIKVPRDQSVKKQNTKQDATVKGNQGLGEIISHYYKQNNRYYQ